MKIERIRKLLMLHVNSEGIVLMSFVVCKFFHHLPKHGDRFMTLPTYCDITRILTLREANLLLFIRLSLREVKDKKPAASLPKTLSSRTWLYNEWQ